MSRRQTNLLTHSVIFSRLQQMHVDTAIDTKRLTFVFPLIYFLFVLEDCL